MSECPIRLMGCLVALFVAPFYSILWALDGMGAESGVNLKLD
jgi:hypothetical protein